MSKKTGVKHDDGKIRYELLPPELLEEVSKVLTFGAKKYSSRNWELGIEWSRVYGALQRHLWTWWDGNKDDLDDETKYSHLAHAACCIAFLLTFEKRKIGDDDRPINLEGYIMLRKVKDKKFKTKKEASDWAKKEKKKSPPGQQFKWETNRLDTSGPMKWEAVIFRNV